MLQECVNILDAKKRGVKFPAARLKKDSKKIKDEGSLTFIKVRLLFLKQKKREISPELELVDKVFSFACGMR